MKPPVLIGAGAALVLAAALTLSLGGPDQPGQPGQPGQHRSSSQATLESSPQGIHKIQHVIVIMQENRSFDSYFGTFPGADGIPQAARACPTRSTAAASSRTSITPTATPAVRTQDPNSTADIDHGKMDGFVGRGRDCTAKRRRRRARPT